MDENLSMKDFEAELSRSFQKLHPGDFVTGTVIGISESEVTVDLNYFVEGIIPLAELSNDPHFSIKADMTVGEEVTCVVVSENREGSLILSRKQAENTLSWDTLTELMEEKRTLTVKIKETVPAGAIAYVHGIRGFIPASQLSLTYVEDTSVYMGKEVQAVILTVDRTNEKLVLSVKEVLKEKEKEAHNSRVAALPVGTVTEGTVETIMPYGAFVSIGNGLSGLLHISQISNKRLKSPNEVLKVGQTVVVKLLDVKDGKISLSMRAVEEENEVEETIEETPAETYSSEEIPAPTLGDLLSKLNLKL
ncbi:MAG: S1 RNA-binding domain-containing protein [Lachnospiraceae bacterium]|nr:S1 RNA-binding domain-containing protein [Lachnospiraceae bacterium]